MKIERLNENQIRCTLNKSDLASRQLKINELAYGSDKAKELFRDMMQQASYELGFEAEDTPLMIEAIPVSSECIVLIVTKVDNPEELDTRFSRFSPSDSDDDNFDFDDIETIEGNDYSDFSLPTANEELDECAATDEEGLPEDELMNIFNRVKEYFNKDSDNKASQSSPSQPSGKGTTDRPEHRESANISRVFSFSSLDDITNAPFTKIPIQYIRILLTEDTICASLKPNAILRISIKSAIFFLNMDKRNLVLIII